MPQNLLVTGANGQLGNEMQRIVAANPGKVNAYFTDVDTLDITDAAAVRSFIEHNAIDVIVNCAAYTAVDRAEDDMVLCAKLNIDAPTTYSTASSIAPTRNPTNLIPAPLTAPQSCKVSANS